MVLEMRMLLMAIVGWESMDFSRDGDALTPVCWHGCPHPLGTGSHCNRNQGARPCALGCAYGSIHNLDDCLARSANSALGGVLSLALSSIVGSLLLFLGCLVFDGWLWRRSSPANLAPPWPGGEHYWGADVWHFRELCVRDRDPPGRR